MKSKYEAENGRTENGETAACIRRSLRPTRMVPPSYIARRQRILPTSFALVILVLLSSFHVSPVTSEHYFSGRRRVTATGRRGLLSGRLLSTSVRPVSYRSQDHSPFTPSSSSMTADEFYSKRGYRPWNVDFSPRSPGQYSWTSRIVIVNALCYVLQVLNPSITQMGVKLSDPLLRGEQLWRCVTPIFLHGGLVHLLTNTYSLQAVGNDVERYFGPGRFLFTYLVSGVVGNFVSAAKTPNPGLGASGAIFGIVGAYYVFLNRNMNFFGRQGEYMAGAISRTIVMNVFLGAMSPMVDNYAHLGGAIGGAACAYLFGPRLMVGVTPTGGRTIVDRPMLRLPRVLEEMPDTMGERLRVMRQRIQAVQLPFKSDLPETPWRRRQRIDYRKRQNVAPKSVRPSF